MPKSFQMSLREMFAWLALIATIIAWLLDSIHESDRRGFKSFTSLEYQRSNTK